MGFFMKKLDLEALVVCGFEGMWGLVVMILLVLPLTYALPGNDAGSNENTIDSVEMLRHSSEIFISFVALVLSCLAYNLSGIGITSALTAVHRVICEAMRTLVVWAFAVYVHYFVDKNSGFGEPLTQYSAYELLGFAVLILGQVLYGALIRIPKLKYPPAKFEDASPFMSPSAMKSPLYAL